MDTYFALFFLFLVFFCGASIGSFVCAYMYRSERQDTGEADLGKRSVCDNCGKTLKYWQLMPVVSWLASFGKCLYCRKKIPVEYFLVEVLSGSFFVLFFIYFLSYFLGQGFEVVTLFVMSFLLTGLLGSFIVFLAYEDYRSKHITSVILYMFTAFSFLFFLVNNNFSAQAFLTGGSLLVFLFLLDVVFKNAEKYFGFADVYVLLSLYFLFGLNNFINIFLYSIWFGAIYSLVYMYIKHGRYVRGLAMPFLPFVFAGLVIFLVFTQVFNFYIFNLEDILPLWRFLFP